MLQRLRHRPVIGGDDQQRRADAEHAGQHVGKESLMAGHVDEADPTALGQIEIGETEIDRHAAALFLREPIGIDAGERADQRGLAVIDMACQREDHRGVCGLESSVNMPGMVYGERRPISTP